MMSEVLLPRKHEDTTESAAADELMSTLKINNEANKGSLKIQFKKHETMIRILIIFLFIPFGMAAQINAQDKCGPYPDIFEGSYVFIQVDQMPVFPGGQDSLLRFIFKNISFPELTSAQTQHTFLSSTFIVDTTGRVRNPCITDWRYDNIPTQLDIEVVQAMRMVPLWKPGSLSGKKVPVRFYLPLHFDAN